MDKVECDLWNNWKKCQVADRRSIQKPIPQVGNQQFQKYLELYFFLKSVYLQISFH